MNVAKSAIISIQKQAKFIWGVSIYNEVLASKFKSLKKEQKYLIKQFQIIRQMFKMNK